MYIKNLFRLLILFTSVSFGMVQAQSNSISCTELKNLKSSLNSIKKAKDFNTSNPKVQAASLYMNRFFKTLLSAKSEKESKKHLQTVQNCLSSKTLANAQDSKVLIGKLVVDLEDFEKESFSMLEIACAGFGIKELLAFSGGKAATAGAVGMSVASAAAAVTGWVVGETILLADSQTGSHGQSAFAKYIINPIVKRFVSGPSERDLVNVKSNELTTNFLLEVKNKKFKRHS